MKNKKEDVLQEITDLGQEMDRTALFEKIKSKYWACSDCMTEAGGTFPEGHVCTVIISTCEVCESPVTQTLIPYVDYDWNHTRTKHLRD